MKIEDELKDTLKVWAEKAHQLDFRYPYSAGKLNVYQECAADIELILYKKEKEEEQNGNYQIQV